MARPLFRVKFMQQEFRAWIAFALMCWALPLAFYAGQHWLNADEDYADQGITGPYAVAAAGTEDGRQLYVPDGKISYVMPGQRFGWISTMCLETGVSMLAHVDVVRLQDAAVVVAGPQRLWTPKDGRCGPRLGTMIMPLDAEDGGYRLRRVGTTRPFTWMPLAAHLSGLDFQVRRRDLIPPEPASAKSP